MEKPAVVFVEPETPENIGFMARSMKNFGLEKLYLTGIPEVPKMAEITAVHAKDVLKNSEITTLEKLREKYKLVATSGKRSWQYNLDRDWISLEKFEPVKNMALVFGRESHGLYNSELELCSQLVYIEADPDYPILNVSHAAAILFYKLYKKEVEELPEAENEVKDVLCSYFEDMVNTLPYTDKRKETAVKIFRNILRRRTTKREAHGLCGVLKDIAEKKA